MTSVHRRSAAAIPDPLPATGRLLTTWRFWVTLFNRREPADTIACFRIAIGLVMLYSLLSIAYFDLVEVLWVDAAAGGYRTLGQGNWLLAWCGGPTPAVVNGCHAVAVAGAALTVVGWGGRPVLFITLQAYAALISINGDTVGGYDFLLTNAMWLLVLSDCMATRSLRCRRATGSWRSDVAVPAWPRYLAVFQLLVMYTATGLYKLKPEWTPGGDFSALFAVFQDPTWRRFDMDFTAWIFPLTQVGTAVTWLFEISSWWMLVVFYCRYTPHRGGRLRAVLNRWDLRRLFTAIGMCLHIGILVTLNVGPFSWVTLSYYLCMWGPDEIATTWPWRAVRAVCRRFAS